MSYKLVSFFVTLILWVSMLSRKDAVITREMNLQYLLPAHTILIAQNQPKKVVIRLSGPRITLQRYLQSDEDLTLDLTRMPTGRVRVHLTQSNLSLPLGLRVMAIDPEEILVDLKDEPIKGDER